MFLILRSNCSIHTLESRESGEFDDGVILHGAVYHGHLPSVTIDGVTGDHIPIVHAIHVDDYWDPCDQERPLVRARRHRYIRRWLWRTCVINAGLRRGEEEEDEEEEEEEEEE